MKIPEFLIVLLLSSSATALGQEYRFGKDPFAHTFSIVARDARTGEMAVGVQSHWFSVGTLVPWGKSGVGVVATQSFVNPAYGPEGLDLMEKGKTADQALEILLLEDEGRAFRQVAFLDQHGNTAVHTGKNCVEVAADYAEQNFSVQANMMLNDQVIPAMREAFKKHTDLPLAERVLRVLEAAQSVGGDIRGKQSAALIVVGPEKVANSWEDKRIDLRVDDHENPIQELGRLLKVARAYQYMNRGDVAMEEGNVETALEQYGEAMKLFPENLEMQYWTAVAMVNSGQLEEALPIFRSIFEEDDNWREMTRRLPRAGLLHVSQAELEQIINL